jgi:2-oxoglutarate ferredoxin oxidoreductase subunit alpha
VEFYGRTGGVVPFPDEILGEIHRIAAGRWSGEADPRVSWQTRMASVIEK